MQIWHQWVCQSSRVRQARTCKYVSNVDLAVTTPTTVNHRHKKQIERETIFLGINTAICNPPVYERTISSWMVEDVDKICEHVVSKSLICIWLGFNLQVMKAWIRLTSFPQKCPSKFSEVRFWSGERKQEGKKTINIRTECSFKLIKENHATCKLTTRTGTLLKLDGTVSLYTRNVF